MKTPTRHNKFLLQPPRWLQRLCSALLLLAVIHASGLGLNMTQALAWSAMAINYTHDYGLREGLSRTFDGQHPCRLCCAIKKVEKPSFSDLLSRSLDEIRLPLITPDSVSVCLPAVDPELCKLTPYRFSLLQWQEDVLTPPPLA